MLISFLFLENIVSHTRHCGIWFCYFFIFWFIFFDREEGGFIMMALRNDKIVLYNVFMLNIPIFSFISVASLASVVEQVVETRIWEESFSFVNSAGDSSWLGLWQSYLVKGIAEMLSIFSWLLWKILTLLESDASIVNYLFVFWSFMEYFLQLINFAIKPHKI